MATAKFPSLFFLLLASISLVVVDVAVVGFAFELFFFLPLVCVGYIYLGAVCVFVLGLLVRRRLGSLVLDPAGASGGSSRIYSTEKQATGPEREEK